jgi:hypothetical protein
MARGPETRPGERLMFLSRCAFQCRKFTASTPKRSTTSGRSPTPEPERGCSVIIAPDPKATCARNLAACMQHEKAWKGSATPDYPILIGGNRNPPAGKFNPKNASSSV